MAGLLPTPPLSSPPPSLWSPWLSRCVSPPAAPRARAPTKPPPPPPPRHDGLPTVRGDPSQLTQLFQNLIGNAVKFRGPDRAEVQISAVRRGGEWLFLVRDNGIGIAPEYRERIFVIFQRLHGRNEYPGTGIGLAICKRIVTRHGGRIWVESQPGRGPAVCFTLSRAETPGAGASGVRLTGP